MFQLLHLAMTAPRKDDRRSSAVWKANLDRAAHERAARRRSSSSARESQAALYKDNLRRKPPEPADIEKVDLDKALAFYKDRFGDVVATSRS